MNLGAGVTLRPSPLIQRLAAGKVSISKSIYATLRISRKKNKVGILGVYWDSGFLGVKDRIIYLMQTVFQTFFMDDSYV